MFWIDGSHLVIWAVLGTAYISRRFGQQHGLACNRVGQNQDFFCFGQEGFLSN